MSRIIPALLLCATLTATTQLSAQTYSTDNNSQSELGFGAAVAIGGDQLFVAEPNNRFRPGIVYVFGKSTDGSWPEQVQLTSNGAAVGDRFGRAIAVDGTTLMVSSQSREEGASGAVHVFGRDNAGNWKLVGNLSAPEGASGDQFGASIAISGDEAFVGAPMYGDTVGTIFRFRRTAGQWQPAGKLVAASGKAGDRLGTTLLLEDNDLFAGVPTSDSARGAVRHFQRTAGNWVEAAAPLAGNLEAGDRFGASLAMRGERLWVGSPGKGGGMVASFNYDQVAGSWQENPPLQRFDGVNGTSFGASLAASDDGLWVGVPGGRGGGGQVHLYRFAGPGWGGVEVLTPGAMASDQGFGNTLAVADGVALVGITGSEMGSGNALVMEHGTDGWKGTTPLTSPPEALPAITGDQVRCVDGEAAKFACNAVDVVSFMPVSEIGGIRGMRLNDLWGWTDSTTNREYSIIGRSDGTSFVDLTDPSHPRYLGDLPMTPGSHVAVWRDMKVYRNHAYIVADGAGQHGVQVFNLERLRKITTPETFEPDYLYTNIASAHNIVIDEETGFGYVVGASGGGETCGGGLHMLDLHKPELPTFVGCHSDGVTGRRGTGYSHDAQCLVYRGPDEDYKGHEICVGSNETALSLADVSDKKNTKVISTVTYPKVAYTHQGWFSEDQRWFFSNDEGDEGKGDPTRTLVWDMSDLDDPILAKQYYATTMDTDHNLYVRGNFMYQSNYGAGLRILDISNPTDPKEVGFFNTNSQGSGASWSNYPYYASGVIAVTGGNTGIFFLKKREQMVP